MNITDIKDIENILPSIGNIRQEGSFCFVEFSHLNLSLFNSVQTQLSKTLSEKQIPFTILAKEKVFILESKDKETAKIIADFYQTIRPEWQKTQEQQVESMIEELKTNIELCTQNQAPDKTYKILYAYTKKCLPYNKGEIGDYDPSLRNILQGDTNSDKTLVGLESANLILQEIKHNLSLPNAMARNAFFMSSLDTRLISEQMSRAWHSEHQHSN